MTDEHGIGDAPIEQRYHEMMNALAAGLDDVLNGRKDGDPRDTRHTGFILMVFPFDGHAGRCNYISTASRDDVIVLLREQLARFAGTPDQTGRA